MADILGTSGNDTLVGTSENDTLTSLGGVDVLTGADGADEYVLWQGSGGSTVSIWDQGGDGAVDTISGGRGLYSSASFGYQSWATVARIGDNLEITLPSKPYRFRKPGYGPLSIEIVDHYDGSPVEILQFGTTEYRLADSFLGSLDNDILAGTSLADSIMALAGDDFIGASDGNDTVFAGDGNDTIFTGDGNNLVDAGEGYNMIFGGADNDSISAGNGGNRIDAGAGDNHITTGQGSDTITAADGNDRITSSAGVDLINAGNGNNTVVSGDGDDTISTGTGNDLLVGGNGGDTYLVASDGSGSDTIRDNGDAAVITTGWLTHNMDEVTFSEYSTLYEAIRSLNIQRSDTDLVLTYRNSSTPLLQGHVRVENHFSGDQYALERVDFGIGATGIFHISMLEGDGFTYSVHNGPDAGGNDIVLGTLGNDLIYGGLGNDLMLGGGGSDRFIFEDEEDGGTTTDVILDFNPEDDILDFREIKSLQSHNISISTSIQGHALISSSYGAIELIGIEASDIDTGSMVFNGASDPTALAAVGRSETGSELDDIFIGSSQSDRIAGAGGADTIEGQIGNDTLQGGVDSDRLEGGDGADLMAGNAGNDFMLGGDGSDRMFGGGGRDVLSGGAGFDRLDGSNGNDTLYGNAGNDTINGGTGDDLISGGNQNDLLLGREGFDLLRGGNGNDRIYSGASNDLVAGNRGSDTLEGGSGNDAIFGGSGADRIIGGAGQDTLSGGTGNDMFVFRNSSDSPAMGAMDRIVDFTAGQDILDLSALSPGLTYVTAPTGALGEVWFDEGLGLMMVNLGGESGADFAVMLDGVEVLSASDFLF